MIQGSIPFDASDWEQNLGQPNLCDKCVEACSRCDTLPKQKELLWPTVGEMEITHSMLEWNWRQTTPHAFPVLHKKPSDI